MERGLKGVHECPWCKGVSLGRRKHYQCMIEESGHKLSIERQAVAIWREKCESLEGHIRRIFEHAVDREMCDGTARAAIAGMCEEAIGSCDEDVD